MSPMPGRKGRFAGCGVQEAIPGRELEKDILRERVIAGVRRAQAAGKHCGRPRRELDLRAAKVLLDGDHSVRQVADMLGLPRATLQRRLREAGIPTGPGGPEPQGAEAA